MKYTLLILLTVFALGLTTRAQTKFELDGNRLKPPKAIKFVGTTDRIAEESEESLKHVKEFLEAKTYVTTLRIEVHTTGGNASEAQKLSESRSLVIAKWLVANGVDCQRLAAVGFGATKPNVSEADAAENERVEFHIAALRNRPIGGQPVDGGGKTAGDVCPVKK